MSKFEKELCRSKSVINASDEIDKDQADSGLLLTAIRNKFKDWQPPKKLVEVPQFVADWFENNEDDLSFKIWGYLINWKLQDKKSDFFKWMKNESECIEILIRMKLDGYTVKKEKLFYLKNKITQEYLYDNDGDFSECEKESLGFDAFKFEFTKSEIEDMETGSYEQIEVDK